MLVTESVSLGGGAENVVAVVVVQSLSCVHLFATSWTAACQVSLHFTIFRNLLKLMCIESVGCTVTHAFNSHLIGHLVCDKMVITVEEKQ